MTKYTHGAPWWTAPEGVIYMTVEMKEKQVAFTVGDTYKGVELNKGARPYTTVAHGDKVLQRVGLVDASWYQPGDTLPYLLDPALYYTVLRKPFATGDAILGTTEQADQLPEGSVLTAEGSRTPYFRSAAGWVDRRGNFAPLNPFYNYTIAYKH